MSATVIHDLLVLYRQAWKILETHFWKIRTIPKWIFHRFPCLYPDEYNRVPEYWSDRLNFYAQITSFGCGNVLCPRCCLIILSSRSRRRSFNALQIEIYYINLFVTHFNSNLILFNILLWVFLFTFIGPSYSIPMAMHFSNLQPRQIVFSSKNEITE